MSSARWMRGAGTALMCGAMSRQTRTAANRYKPSLRHSTYSVLAAAFSSHRTSAGGLAVAGIPATHTKGCT